MFISALFTKTKTWEQPECPSTDEWTKMWCVYTVACGSAIKKNGGEKNEIMPFAATWMDPEVIILSQVRKRKDK